MTTLVDKIVQEIREDIFRGELAPGDPLKQVELANHYGVSPIPLREALQRLQVEGLVEYFAYRGAIVARLKRGEAADIAGVRHALESLAFEIAMPTLDDAQLAKLADLTAQLEATEGQTATAFMDNINAYYAVLLSKANRPLLLEMIQITLKRATRYYAEVLRKNKGKRLNDAPTRWDYLESLKARDMARLSADMKRLHEAYVNFFEANFEA
ncbi:GntR family transcriptional regulator [Chitinimonas sp. BJYL2]|uniref:GntR family transcriptional regulator n=1 Tax=Chitinimonas sp. BJYL2 TaxID=2976696 RepID=UPI0022B4A4FA|nr:GntR family transcriptional regulator [Chitinimonas sp. BJYL2]